jgi:transcriptional regulator with XRE-family HTH domain
MAGEDRTAVLNVVAEQLVSYRAAEGLDFDEAAEEADIDPERLAAAEAGEIALTEDELNRLAETYGVSVTAFFGGHVTPMSYLFGA